MEPEPFWFTDPLGPVWLYLVPDHVAIAASELAGEWLADRERWRVTSGRETTVIRPDHIHDHSKSGRTNGRPSGHNWQDVNRIDVWFEWRGRRWHGVNLSGSFGNQCLRCVPLKPKKRRRP